MWNCVSRRNKLAPTLGFASLPPEGAFAAWGGPALLKAPTLGFVSLPPEGALAAWGGPALLDPVSVFDL